VSVLPPDAAENLDVAEDVGLRFFASHVNHALDALAFEEFEDALSDHVVVTVAAPAHAADQSMRFHELLPALPSELRALIRVHQQSRGQQARNIYVRWLLIHGARSCVMYTDRRRHRREEWLDPLACFSTLMI
jgi:hypothetical protein